MNLISCSNCGVVLDKDKLNFTDEPEDIYEMSEEERNAEGWLWDSDAQRFVAFVPCPVCKNLIQEYGE